MVRKGSRVQVSKVAPDRSTTGAFGRLFLYSHAFIFGKYSPKLPSSPLHVIDYKFSNTWRECAALPRELFGELLRIVRIYCCDRTKGIKCPAKFMIRHVRGCYGVSGGSSGFSCCAISFARSGMSCVGKFPGLHHCDVPARPRSCTVDGCSGAIVIWVLLLK